MLMGQHLVKFVLIILILQVFISQDQQVCSITCGKRSERIWQCINLIHELLVKQAVKILYWHIKAADPDVVVTALLRGAFEFQGQKCSAASRAYIPSNLAEEVKKKLIAGCKEFEDGNGGRFHQFYQCSDR